MRGGENDCVPSVYPDRLMHGGLWEHMDGQRRHAMKSLTSRDLPEAPGVYALYRDDDRRVYVGKADSLRARVWGDHSGRGRVLTGSALRRTIAEHLGFGAAAAIKARQIQPTDEQVAAVRGWLDECGIAWIECRNPTEAAALEMALKDEFRPMLTKR